MPPTQRDSVSDAKEHLSVLGMGVDMTVWAWHAWQEERTHKSSYAPAVTFLCVLLLSTTIRHQFLYKGSSLSVWSKLLFLASLLIFKECWYTPVFKHQPWVQKLSTIWRSLSMPRWTLPEGTRRWVSDGVPKALRGIAAMPQQAQDALWGHIGRSRQCAIFQIFSGDWGKGGHNLCWAQRECTTFP